MHRKHIKWQDSLTGQVQLVVSFLYLTGDHTHRMWSTPQMTVLCPGKVRRGKIRGNYVTTELCSHRFRVAAFSPIPFSFHSLVWARLKPSPHFCTNPIIPSRIFYFRRFGNVTILIIPPQNSIFLWVFSTKMTSLWKSQSTYCHQQ